MPRVDLVVGDAEDARGHLQVEVAPGVERFGHRALPEEVEADLGERTELEGGVVRRREDAALTRDETLAHATLTREVLQVRLAA